MIPLFAYCDHQSPNPQRFGFCRFSPPADSPSHHAKYPVIGSGCDMSDYFSDGPAHYDRASVRPSYAILTAELAPRCDLFWGQKYFSEIRIFRLRRRSGSVIVCAFRFRPSPVGADAAVFSRSRPMAKLCLTRCADKRSTVQHAPLWLKTNAVREHNIADLTFAPLQDIPQATNLRRAPVLAC